MAEGGDAAGWLLALHSCGEGFSVGLLAWPPSGDRPWLPARLDHFATDRDLSNRLLSCLETVLPAAQWSRLRRLAVATGPGGFTSTRLSVVLARTLAQQDHIPLDGISSFQLIARRLSRQDSPPPAPFWLVSELPRRGLVVGRYDLDASVPGGVVELEAPHLRDAQAPALEGTVLAATPCLPDDVEQLLTISAERGLMGVQAPWQMVVPLYPTSPVQL